MGNIDHENIRTCLGAGRGPGQVFRKFAPSATPTSNRPRLSLVAFG